MDGVICMVIICNILILILAALYVTCKGRVLRTRDCIVGVTHLSLCVSL